MKEVRHFISSKRYMLPLIIVALICYGYAATNIAVGIDDLEGDLYIGPGKAMLAAGRFGMVFWARLFGFGTCGPFHSYAIDVISVLLFMATAILICTLFQRASNDRISMFSYTAFSCILVSYPLINEIWEYTGANMNVCGGYCFAALSALIVWNELHREGKKPRAGLLVIAALLMMIVCAAYESLAAVYVFIVFAALALQVIFGKPEERRVSTILRQGLFYAGVLLVGILLRIIVHKLTLVVLSLESSPMGATQVLWGKAPFFKLLRHVLTGVYHNYILRGLVYFPLMELVVFGALLFVVGLVICKRTKAWTLLIPGAGLFISLILISLLQGSQAPYRTCQVFAVFVAFVVLALMEAVSRCNLNKGLMMCLRGLVILLCIHQATYLNYLLTVNSVRSEEEAYVVREIGKDLKQSCDLEKPVIFVGNYALSTGIQEAVTIPEDSFRWKLYLELISNNEENPVVNRNPRIVETNVNSVLYWAVDIIPQTSIQKLFRYYGTDVRLADYEQTLPEAKAYIAQNEMPFYPKEGYIADAGEYLIVYLGAIES